MSESLQPQGLWHTRLFCPLLSPVVCSNSCPLSQWCHPTMSSSVTYLSSVSQLFVSSGQSIGASASVLLMNVQGWFSLGLTDLISLLSKGLSRVFSSTIVQKHQFFSTQHSLWFNSHIHTWLLEKSALATQTFVSKVMSLLFNMLSRFVITFLPSGVF